MGKNYSFARHAVILSLLLPMRVLGFSIELEINGDITKTQERIFTNAKEKWERVIINNNLGKEKNYMKINISAVEIDGVGTILGQACPTEFWDDKRTMPFEGMIEFDTADLNDMEEKGLLPNVALHEMAHTMGFGTIWETLGLIGGTNDDPYFKGKNAINAYQRLTNTRTPRYVPLENDGGEGTARSHWRESIFKNELMTGYIDDGINPLSRLTIASFRDLGYTVDYSAADGYKMPEALFNKQTRTFIEPSHVPASVYSGGTQGSLRTCQVRSLQSKNYSASILCFDPCRLM